MSELVRCSDCNGKKYVYGMGMMRKDCSLCKAIGWVNAEETPKIVGSNDNLGKFDDLPAVEKMRKPGRPKKVSDL